MSVAAVLAAGWVQAAEPARPAAPAVDETVLLGENTLWAQFRVAGPNYVRNADGSLSRVKIKINSFELSRVESVDQRGSWNLTGDWDAADATPAPAPDWASPTFDAGAWPRERLPLPSGSLWLPAHQTGNLFGSTGTFNQFDTTKLLTRATFTVKDPAQVKSLRLSLDYWGGVVVYVNGKEAMRADLADAQKDQAEIVAKDYPLEAFLMPDGKPLPADDDKNKERLVLRDRQLRDFAIPAALLRPGVNVLAIECRAAPFPSQAVQAKGSGADWPPIGILKARLTVSPGTSATGPRPVGIQVWNVMPYDTVTTFDYGDTTRPLRPIEIRAARNSVFSGRLMVSSDQPIKGLKVTVTDLQAKAGVKLPAAAVRVRYAVPATTAKSYAPPAYRFDGLLDAIPAEIPVIEASLPKGSFYHQKLERRALPTVAMAPLWFTVKVPRDLPAGEYEGQVRVVAEGLAETKAPLRVKVSAWTMPDPKDFRIQNGLYEAEEVVARHYDVPNYSDRHLELVGKSLALLAELNSRQVQANLTINFCGRDNPETIVRWIKQPDGSFKHDFTVFDKYLDMVAKSVGTPNTLRLNCWPGAQSTLGDRNVPEWGGTMVSVLDPATGKLDKMPQPAPGTPESYAFWKPVFDEMLLRLKNRGWLSQTTLGYNREFGTPQPAMVENAHKLWPEGQWTWISHWTFEGARFVGMFKGADDGSTMGTAFGFANPGGLEAWVKQNPQAGVDPEKIVRMTVRHSYSVKATPTGKLPPLWTLDGPRRNSYGTTARGAIMDKSALREVRRMIEINTLHRGFDGVGEFGADVFKVKSPTGRYDVPPVAGGAGWGGMDRTTMSLLYPAPDGPVATERFEMFREGLELAEAVIFVRHALHKGLLSGELKERAERYLAPKTGERDRTFWNGAFMPRYMQDMEDAKLLDLAGAVAQVAGGGGRQGRRD